MYIKEWSMRHNKEQFYRFLELACNLQRIRASGLVIVCKVIRSHYDSVLFFSNLNKLTWGRQLIWNYEAVKGGERSHPIVSRRGKGLKRGLFKFSRPWKEFHIEVFEEQRVKPIHVC